MAAFPLDPHLARALVASQEFGCTLDVIDIISVLSASSKLFFDSTDEREAASEARRKFKHPSGDHMTILNVVKSYREIASSETKNGRKEWCRKQFLNDRCLAEAHDICEQLREVCTQMHIDWRTCCGDDERPVLKSLVRGLVQRTAFLQPDGSYKQLMGPSVSHLCQTKVGFGSYFTSQLVKIHPSSSLCDKKVPMIVYDELVSTSCCSFSLRLLISLIWDSYIRLTFMLGVYPQYPEVSLQKYQFSITRTKGDLCIVM